MKAVLCKSFGPAEILVLEEVASPEPKKNHGRTAGGSASICLRSARETANSWSVIR